MIDSYYGLHLEQEERDGGVTTFALSDHERLLGIAIAQDGIATVIIVDCQTAYQATGAFMKTDDALMAIKTYHDVRSMIEQRGRKSP